MTLAVAVHFFLFFIFCSCPPSSKRVAKRWFDKRNRDLKGLFGDTQRFGGTEMLRAWCSEVLRPFHTALSLLLVFTMTVCLHLASKWLGYLTQPAKKCSFARQLGAVNCTTRRHFLGHVLQLCRFLFTLPRGSLRELVRRRERWTTQSLKLMCWQTHIFIFFGKAAA